METELPQPSSVPPRSSAKAILVIVLVLAILGAAVSYTVVRDSNEAQEQTDEESRTAEEFQEVAPNVIVYGNWAGDNSVIKAFNLQTGEKKVLAELKAAIKKVQLLSGDALLYIDNTNDSDHGNGLTRYTVSSGEEAGIYKADPGFGIDDYVLSPNKQYAAVWEVRLAEDTGILRGGASRVYAIDLSNPATKNRLYDEVQVGEAPVHYPRAVTNNGEVYLDRFLPNSLAGWAYGMSVSNLQGTQKQTLSNMVNGTYGTQPSLSPDGRYLVFAGYDGRLGPGTTEDEDGFRRAIISSNTVELLDTATKQRRKLSNLSNANTYSYTSWDPISGKIVFMQIVKSNPALTGTYTYDLAMQAATKIALDPEGAEPTTGYASQLSNGMLLVGTPDAADSSEGNLGNAYAAPYTMFMIMDPTGNGEEVIEIDTKDSMMQLIDVLPDNYFSGTGGVVAAASDNKNGSDKEAQNIDTECNKANTQLCTFSLKPKLSEKRQKQQSEPDPRSPQRSRISMNIPQQRQPQQPKCRDAAFKQCGGTDPDCVGKAYLNQKSSNSCDDSPLYLYGTPGQKVIVKIGTHVFADTPSYNDGYTVTLLSGGRMQVGSNVYEGLEYAYTPALRKVTVPSYGTVVAQDGMSGALQEYALRLGLNEKETRDLVQYGKETITAPYVFVSFFDHATSHRILPLSFTPEPDNYLNVVFYFREFAAKPNITPTTPLFTPFLDRSGFTAVEVSAMVE